MRIWCVHQGPQGERSGSGEPSALSGQVTLNDPEIGWPRLPEEEHSITPAACLCACVHVCVCVIEQPCASKIPQSTHTAR